ncbi:nitroreductase family protein [Nautilia lithotrophica]
MNIKNTKIWLFFRSIKTFLKTFSLRRAKFVWYEGNLNIEKLDNDMLLTQIGYFGHHLEKALKHHNRGKRGVEKRNKLELLLNEAIKRRIKEDKVFNWAKDVIKYFDNNSEIYIKEIDDIKIHPYKDDILKAIKERTTIRFWQQKEVPNDIIEDILYTAMHAPLSCNRQSIRFVVVKNKIENMVVGDSNNKSIFEKAPMLIYIADDDRFFPEKYGNALDVGGVCAMIQLAASVYGLGSVWIYHCESYEQNNLKKQLGLPEYMYIYSSIALGYPLDKQEKPPRYSKDRFILHKKL